MKFSTAIAATALMLTLGAPAFAQTGTTQAGATQAGMRLSNQSLRSSRLIGQTVIGDKGEQLCVVEDVLLNPGGAEPTVVMSHAVEGKTERRLIAMPLSKVVIEHEKVRLVGVTKQDVEKMPTYGLTYGSG